MSEPRDGWDADERDALDGLGEELAELRARHATDPPLDVLRAADANALPEEMQKQVAEHLQSSAWSRALVEGLRDAQGNDRLDSVTEQRMLDRITRQAAAAAPRQRWRMAIAVGGFAVAATLLLAVLVSRRSPERVVPVDAVAPPQAATGINAAPQPAAPLLIAYTKPDVKLSTAVLTWRGDADNPLLRDLAPAFEAYRADDYARAVAAFDKLAAQYPAVVDVLFYQGVSRMLAGDDAGAVGPLAAAEALNEPAFLDDAPWFLAVAQQRSGSGEPRRLFQQLCRGKSSYAADACKAVALLDAAAR